MAIPEPDKECGAEYDMSAQHSPQSSSPGLAHPGDDASRPRVELCVQRAVL